VIFRVLEHDERVFAVLLAVGMVAGLATLGLFPLRPRYQIDLYRLVFWFAAYKLGVFALVTVHPRATRLIFLAALAIDLGLVFALLCLTGGWESPFYLLFFPLVAVNAYYFGPFVGWEPPWPRAASTPRRSPTAVGGWSGHRLRARQPARGHPGLVAAASATRGARSSA
jgi:hypothetical protein